MAQVVDEIMNRELFAVHPTDSAQQALDYILTMNISGAPVLDPYGIPVGMITLRDLAIPGAIEVHDRMTTPVVALLEGTPIEEAAKSLGERGLHRSVVVNAAGIAVGLVSSLDLMRALVGLPAKHPDTFPHKDPSTGLVWTDDDMLTVENLDSVPGEGGVLALVHGGKDLPERVIWAEAAPNLHQHLLQLLREPAAIAPRLADAIKEGNVRFRYSVAPDIAQRMQALRKVLLSARDKARGERG